jgi:hypothetical protein
MQDAVEVLLVLGIVINFIKGADLILRPHQQKWLQQRLDTLALHLDYTKPLEWYKRRAVGSKMWLLICALIFFVSGFILTWLFNKPRWGLILIFPGLSALTVELTAHVAELNRRFEKIFPNHPGPKAVSRSTEKLINWFMQSGTTVQLIVRPTILALGTALLSIAFQRILRELAARFPQFLEPAIKVLVVVLAVFWLLKISRHKVMWEFRKMGFVQFIMVFMGIGAISVIMLISGLIMFISELALKLLRAITWRIVEYNKGAFAAIILLITIALGIAEIYLKSWSL